jgi:phosphatidylserine synthase
LFTILATLFLFDLFSPPVNWFYGIGLPVTITLFVCVSIIVALWKVAHFKGFNLLAFAFFVLSGFCIVSEVFINKYLFNKADIRWSAIVAVSLLPIALVLLFVHYRMKRGKRLDSYFHV